VNAGTGSLAAERAGEAALAGVPAPLRRITVLAAIAIALGLVALVTVLPAMTPPLPDRGGESLVQLDPKRVRQVDVLPREGAPYSFNRRHQTWTMSAQGQGEVEVPSDRLDGFLETLAGLTRLVVIDGADANLAEFGLAPPRAVVTIRDGRLLSLAIGDRNPPLTALYVQIFPEANITLVGSVLLWEFDKLVALSKTQPVEP
jgi:hypothetical protein